ncbi:MAG TPA: AbrB/MazE/SpoVT family DNA-binding domain-containing protein [Candidatus Binatia bacterium]|nr:AbrB/MazE/SpoVT family DNA-binding domain-containing protein [Candidatus Binatia bacterium]
MKRKVIKLAQQTLVVSLPAAWCKSNGIRKGDEVDCQEKRGSIIFASSSRPSVSEAQFDGDALGILSKRALYELYHAGVDKVTVRAARKQTLQVVNDTLNQLLGYHVVERRGEHLVIEDLGKNDHDLDLLLRRFLLLIKTLVQEGVTALEQKKYDDLGIPWERDTDVNKLAHLCIRILSKNVHIPTDHAARMHTLIYQGEQLADEYKLVMRALQENTAQIPRALDAVRSAARLYDAAYQYVFQRSRMNAQAVAAANDHARRALQQLGSNVAFGHLDSFVKKAVSIQELFLHQMQDVHHGPP